MAVSERLVSPGSVFRNDIHSRNGLFYGAIMTTPTPERVDELLREANGGLTSALSRFSNQGISFWQDTIAVLREYRKTVVHKEGCAISKYLRGARRITCDCHGRNITNNATAGAGEG
jgi:hypothetical protein